MKKLNKQETKAVKMLKDSGRIEKIYDVYSDREFTEVSGSVAGDNVYYRIYNNGMICER